VPADFWTDNRMAMQLRVARLCLDCEELYVGEHCPVCASERYAFLSSWLPSEERRRWRRPAPRETVKAGRLQGLWQLLSSWFGDGEPKRVPGKPRTRMSDRVPKLDFEAPAPQPEQKPVQVREPLREDR
jgi:hypothetical protein